MSGMIAFSAAREGAENVPTSAAATTIIQYCSRPSAKSSGIEPITTALADVGDDHDPLEVEPVHERADGESEDAERDHLGEQDERHRTGEPVVVSTNHGSATQVIWVPVMETKRLDDERGQRRVAPDALAVVGGGVYGACLGSGGRRQGQSYPPMRFAPRSSMP